MTERRFGRRLGVTALVALGAIASFATIGGTGLAGELAKPFKAQYGPGQNQYHAKATICHKGKVTIRVSVNALPAHVRRHGDTVGACTAASLEAAKLKQAKHAKAAKAAKAEKHVAKAEKHVAKAEKHAAKAAARADRKASKAQEKAAKAGASATGSVSAETSTKEHGPPSSPGNGHGNGHGKNKG